MNKELTSLVIGLSTLLLANGNLVLIHLNQYETKTVEKDSDKASMLDSDKATNTTTGTAKITNTTNSLLVNRFIDLDGIMHSFFPSFNTGGGIPSGNFQDYPNNGFQVKNPQENNWNNGIWNTPGSINYPDSPQNYPGQNLQGSNPQYPGNNFNNLNGGNFLVNPNTPQVNNPQYPGNDFNNFNGGNYPVSPNIPQGNNPKYPGNGYNNLNVGSYPVNPNVPQVNNNQQYPGNDFNNNLNGGNYPVNPNIPQGNSPQYPGNSFNNLNGGTYPVNPNIPKVIDNNQQYPSNDYSNLNGGTYPVNPNIPQDSNNQQYPGNDYNNLNGGNYPVNPTIPQVNDPQYPEAGSNLDNSNNWNNNGYPGNYQNHPSYPNEQGQYPGSGNAWNNVNGLQNNQNPNIIVFPEDQVPTQGVQQGHPPALNQGQPRDPQGTFQNGNSGLSNGGSFNPQDLNGVNNLPSGSLQQPLLQYPQTNRPGITTSTTEKVAILGLPVIVSNEFTQKPLLTTSTSSVMKQCVQDCPSTSEYEPVCGSNNVTYFNEGKMECARYCGIDVTVQNVGACTMGSAPGIYG